MRLSTGPGPGKKIVILVVIAAFIIDVHLIIAVIM